MISRFLPVKDGDTVLNYYALPLVDMNRKYFGDNFVTTKVTHDGKVIFVELLEDTFNDEAFPHKVINDDKFYLYFYVPKEHLHDVQLIIEGKYSLLSDKAKDLILTTSGLLNNKKKANGYYTSKLIFALDKPEILIDYYFNLLKSDNAATDAALYEALSEVELTEKIEKDDFV